jgi:prepilin-type N-terminal cleavage/methylation domain-containing protein
MSSKVIHPVNTPKSTWCDLTRLNVARQMGFTMLETLVVLAIVGILTTVGVPAYQRVSVQYDISSTARLFAQQAESARLMAQAHGTVIEGCPVNQLNFVAANPICINNLQAGQPWAAWVWRNRATGAVVFRGQVSPNLIFSTNRSVYPAFNSSGHIAGLANQTVTVSSGAANTVPAQVTFSNQGKMTVTLPP